MFNLSTVAKSERVLTAELHLFKLRPQASVAFNRHHYCQVNILLRVNLLHGMKRYVGLCGNNLNPK